MTLYVPDLLRSSCVSYDRLGWLEALPDLVSSAVSRWGLELGMPFEPGGECAWVAPARDADGRDLVLKVGFTHEESRDEVAGLAAFSGIGAVEVFGHERVEDTTSLLLERARPGHELSVLPEVEQDLVITGLLTQLWQVPVPATPFRPLSVMCEQWATEAEAISGAIDPGLKREGLALLRQLSLDAERTALLCTDLHAGNVLRGTRLPWLVIDPKPYVGDPHYDVLQHFLNCSERVFSDPVGLVRRLADLADLDPDRLRLWAFARCVQASAFMPEGAEMARLLGQ